MATGLCSRIGAIAAIVLHAAVPVLAQDSAITGARVSLVEKPAGTLSVTLQNLRDSPLLVWELRIRPSASAPSVVITTDFTRPFEYGSGSGPLNSLERRLLRIESSDVAPDAEIAVQLAVFADGYCEGEREAFEKYRTRRDRQADDLRFWLMALQQAPRDSDENIRKFLREQLARHAALAVDNEWSAAGMIRPLALENVPRAPGWIRSVLERHVTEMREHLARLEQPLKPGAGGSVDSVTVASAGAPQGRFYAVVENLRDVPIQAFGLRYGSGAMRSFSWSSAAVAPGQGPIQPGERREVPVSIGHGDSPDGPDVTLSFLLFANSRFEGSREERDAVGRLLARRADQLTFTIEALSEAVQQPMEKMVDFLESRKRARAIAIAATPGAPGFTAEIDDVIGLAKTSPAQAVAYANQLIVVLERDRATLSQYLTR